MNPLISVIVPVFKVQKYLHRCVESITSQSYQNLEIILIDDGSPDQCGQICDDFAKLDNRIIVIHTKNRGISCARNEGLKIAKGEYIGFIDSDDWIEKEMYSLLMEKALDHNSELVECDFVRRNQNKQINIYSSDIIVEKSEESLKRIQRPGFFNVWNKLYHKNLIAGLEFLPGKIHQDALFTSEVLQRVESLVFINIPLIHYNEDEENESTTKSAYSESKIGTIEVMVETQNNLSRLTTNKEYLELLRKFMLSFFLKHYTKLFNYSHLDPKKNHRKKVKNLIMKNYSFYDYNLYANIARFLPINFYYLFHWWNQWRIKVKTIFSL